MRLTLAGPAGKLKTAATSMLRVAGHLVNESGPRVITITVREREADEVFHPSSGVVSLDSVDGPVERVFLEFITEHTGGVWVQRRGGNRNDRAIGISLPATDDARLQVEEGILLAVSEIEHKGLLAPARVDPGPAPEPAPAASQPPSAGGPLRRYLRGLRAALLGRVLAAGLLVLLTAPVLAQPQLAPVEVISGTMDTVEDTITLETGGLGSVAIQLTGTWAGVVSFEATVDGSTFVAVDAWPSDSATSASSSTGNGVWLVPAGGYRQVRVRFSTDTSGTVSVDLQGSTAGTKFIAAGASGGTSLADDGDVTAGTTPGTPAIGFYQSVVTACTDGDGCIVGITSDRELKVDITSNTAGVGGGTAYTEDVATPNPIVGTATMMERDDALAGVTPAEGDWLSLRGTAEGALWMQDFNSDAILADTASIDTSAASVATLVIAEDDASGDLDPGSVIFARRTATPADTSGADLDYEALQMDNGRLWASATIDAALPAGSATIGEVTIGAATTATGDLAKAEDVALQDGDVGIAIWAVRDDAPPAATSGAAADFEPLHTNAFGALWTEDHLCGSSDVLHAVINSSADAELVAAAANETVFICGYNFIAAGTVTVNLTAGTGTVCATGIEDLTGDYPLIAQTGIAVSNGGAPQLVADVGDAVCLDVSAAVAVAGILTYIQRDITP